MVFCEDETKYYGVLYSQKPLSAIGRLKEYNKTLEYEKIEKNWYEIGALSDR